MDVMDQDQDHRKQRRAQHERNRTRRHQQQQDRQRAAIDVEMAERVHEILQEEWRPRHQYEQRQLPLVKAEGPPEQCYEKRERHQPGDAGEREHQPNRHFRGEQRHDRADQRTFGEAEMIIGQQMDVGDERRQRDLVNENSDQDSRIDD
jgi:hypothetical protein